LINDDMLYDTHKIGSTTQDQHEEQKRQTEGRLTTQITASAKAQHVIKEQDPTPKD